MKRIAAVALVFAASIRGGPVRAADEAVPLYTNADLDRMFGKSPLTAPAQVAPSTAEEDWRRVESFLDREYARLDADRQYELERRTYVEPRRENDYGGSAAWGLGYPASTWWNNVWGNYAGASCRRPPTLNSQPSTLNHPGGRRVQSSGLRVQRPEVRRSRR